MSYRWMFDADERNLESLVPLDRRDRPWLGLAVVVGLAVAAIYVAFNDYPAYGAGLYTATADQIRANGYALPHTIPHYGAEGVPFAYPPLAFYALAVLRDLGAETFLTARVVPPLVVVATVVPAYLVGRDLLESRVRGAAAAVLVVVNPQVLEWHLSAGGLVRAPAFFFALAGAYAGLRIFRDRDRSWVPVGLGLFALVLLTHPTYSLFVVATYVVFWAGYDRRTSGFVDGLVVGLGGVAVTAPWWLTVASRYGFDVFTAAAGTHGGIGGGLFAWFGGVSVWKFLFVAAVGVALLAGWRVLAAWFLAAELLFQQPRFAYAVGSFGVVAAGVYLVDLVGARAPSVGERRRVIATAALLVVAVAGLGVVTFEYGTGEYRSAPAFVDDDDVEAMEWAERETAADATFVVLGDAAEWFPHVANRTILVSPWGMEWREPAAYDHHLQTFRNASTCQSVDCVETTTASIAPAPDYVYVPKGTYTVRGHRETNFGTLNRSFALDEGYERVYQNDGVVVFRATDGEETEPAGESDSER